jgi:enterochelin esterase-like enzyme
MKFRYLSLLSAIMVTGGVCLAQTNQPAAIEDFRPASTNQPGKQYPQVNIDGAQVPDPGSLLFYGASRCGSGIEVPFKGDGYYAIKNVPHREICINHYYSTVFNRWRQFYIYKPAGYDVNISEKYPVLYILHGGGEDERGWATHGKTDLILDNLIAENKAKPMLIVMPDGNVSGQGFGENTLRMFERELKQCIFPFVEKNYRAETGTGTRALAGLSMGGIQTLYVGMNNTDLFSYLGIFSSGWIIPAQSDLANKQYDIMNNNLDKIKNNLKLIWIGIGGKEDIAYNNCQTMISRFNEMKLKYTYNDYPGGHAWPVWRNNLYNFAQLLFK